MKTESEDKHETDHVLRLREYLYTLFHMLLGSPLKKDGLVLATSETSMEALRQAFAYQGTSSEKIGKQLEHALNTASTQIEEIDQEYTKLFIGPGPLPVMPWETVFRSHDSLLFSNKTLAVRNAYRSAGFCPALSPHIADDHIALEYGFIAALSHEACTAYETKDREMLENALYHTKRFIDQHMLKWIPSYARKVSELDRFPFYSAVIAASSRYLQIDRVTLEEVTKHILSTKND